MNVFKSMMERFAADETLPDVQPPEPEKAAATETLLTLYALPDEIGNVRDRYEAIGIAEAAMSRITDAIQLVDQQMDEQDRRKRVDYLRLAAVALGESAPEPPEAVGTALSLLKNQRQGLEIRLAAAKEEVGSCRGAFRTAVVQLIGRCGERCAEDYLKATKTQAWCHQQMEIAQGLLGESRRLVDPVTWGRYFVPSSLHLPVLQRESREEHFVPALMSADRLTLSRNAALKDLGTSGRKLFGGWPL